MLVNLRGSSWHSGKMTYEKNAFFMLCKYIINFLSDSKCIIYFIVIMIISVTIAKGTLK